MYQIWMVVRSVLSMLSLAPPSIFNPAESEVDPQEVEGTGISEN